MLLAAEPGLFIVFEGPDGCGKGTQLKRAARWLRGIGWEVKKTREPGGTPWGERCRQLLFDKQLRRVPLSEVFMFATARAEHLEELIIPNVEQGRVVLCDRFAPSTVVYQAYATDKVPIQDVVDVDRINCGGCKPDLCLVLWIDPKTSRQRLADRVKKGGEKNLFDKRQHISEGYLRFVEENPLDYPRVVEIDARPDVATVFAVVRSEIAKILPKMGG